MVNRILGLILCLATVARCNAQNKLSDNGVTLRPDSFRQLLLIEKNDSSKILLLNQFGFYYETLNTDSSIKYYQYALDLSRKKGYVWGEARLLASMSGPLRQQGNLADALALLLKSIKIATDNKLPADIARAYRRTGDVFYDLENYRKAVEYTLQSLNMDQLNGYLNKAAIDEWSLADSYEKMNMLDSASYYLTKAFTENDYLKNFRESFYEITGSIHVKRGQTKEAVQNYEQGLSVAIQKNNFVVATRICAGLSAIFKKMNNIDSATYYALRGFGYGQESSTKKGVITNGILLAELYDSVQPSKALNFYKEAMMVKDSLFGTNNLQTIQNLITREESRQKELEAERLSYRNRLKLYGLIAGLTALLIIAIILYRNNRQNKRTNAALQQKNITIENTLAELKSTQAQLFQSEKMASLGELTAGIAHEIQNPLNFVNNFSEVNMELIDELKQEQLKAERNQPLQDELINDIEKNSEKIIFHGKRADAIVKGMLQHSRTSTGHKEPTDINALCDEYLRLSYHGLRAKDKSFNSAINTYFDTDIGKVEIISQDIGRVLLNLYNNAFYAVAERKKMVPSGYEPVITVQTKKTKDHIEISVTDNGTGIPQSIADKIFQPFFTTKPTGQGTGLGLSLSYDIIKAHGANIQMESQEGEGTKFTILL